MRILPDRLEWKRVNTNAGENPYVDLEKHIAIMMGEYGGRLAEKEYAVPEIFNCRPGTPLGNQMHHRITARLTSLLSQLKTANR
jgi:hypothetical protein